MASILDPQQKRKANKALAPLRQGRAVALRVPGVKRKKKRIGQPVLFILPGLSVGMDHRHVLFALPGYGSEVMALDDIKPYRLMHMGLPANAAKILRDELHILFEDIINGKTRGQ